MGTHDIVHDWLSSIYPQPHTERTAKRKESESIDSPDVKRPTRPEDHPRVLRQRKQATPRSLPQPSPFRAQLMPPSPTKHTQPAIPPQPTPPPTLTAPTQPATPAPNAPSSTKSKSIISVAPSLSDSSGPKQTENNDNVRASLAAHGMYFEHEEAWERCVELQEQVKNVVFRERGSAMKVESLQRTRQWRVENATKDERTYFSGMLPWVIKDERTSATTKRNADGEIIFQTKGFDADGLDRRQEPSFVKNILPQKVYNAEKKLGLSNPKPDYCFGLKRPRHPNQLTSQLTNEVQALIGVAPGLEHPFFVIENKGCEDSIESAENQAVRSGATLVAAQRKLYAKVRGAAPPTTGADLDCYAFSCCWVPQMANLYVHWYEQQEDGAGVYHMNLLNAYLMTREGDMTDFRRDVHNILDWGVSTKRKESLTRLVSMIIESCNGSVE